MLHGEPFAVITIFVDSLAYYMVSGQRVSRVIPPKTPKVKMTSDSCERVKCRSPPNGKHCNAEVKLAIAA